MDNDVLEIVKPHSPLSEATLLYKLLLAELEIIPKINKIEINTEKPTRKKKKVINQKKIIYFI